MEDSDITVVGLEVYEQDNYDHTHEQSSASLYERDWYCTCQDCECKCRFKACVGYFCLPYGRGDCQTGCSRTGSGLERCFGSGVAGCSNACDSEALEEASNKCCPACLKIRLRHVYTNARIRETIVATKSAYNRWPLCPASFLCALVFMLIFMVFARVPDPEDGDLSTVVSHLNTVLFFAGFLIFLWAFCCACSFFFVAHEASAIYGTEHEDRVAYVDSPLDTQPTSFDGNSLREEEKKGNLNKQNFVGNGTNGQRYSDEEDEEDETERDKLPVPNPYDTTNLEGPSNFGIKFGNKFPQNK
jgi:hypothetical protein